ncbi:hypothetical protein TSMEX_008614 [Taenia solium]|eukprot:TsM_001108700 transcript=TsM_001108700 gene=TsM_001108700
MALYIEILKQNIDLRGRRSFFLRRSLPEEGHLCPSFLSRLLKPIRPDPEENQVVLSLISIDEEAVLFLSKIPPYSVRFLSKKPSQISLPPSSPHSEILESASQRALDCAYLGDIPKTLVPKTLGAKDGEFLCEKYDVSIDGGFSYVFFTSEFVCCHPGPIIALEATRRDTHSRVYRRL